MNNSTNQSVINNKNEEVAHKKITLLSRMVSSIVIASYMTLTMGQTCAMVETDHCKQSSYPRISLSTSTDYYTEEGKSTTPSTSASKKQYKSSQVVPTQENANSVSRNDGDVENQLSMNLNKVFQGSENERNPSGNSADIEGEPNSTKEFISIRIKEESSELEAFNSYTKKLFWGNKNQEIKKNNRINMVSAALVTGILAYSIKAEGKVASFTVFNALATTPYFYEKFYYNNLSNGYYYTNLFILALTINSAVFLSPFIFDQASEFVRNMRPQAEENVLKERYGFYFEKLVGGIALFSALSAGFMIASQYFVAAYGLKGTPQTSNEDLTALPILLGLSYAMTAYNIKHEVMGNQLRDWYRYAYGDDSSSGKPVDVKRSNFVKAIESYQKEITEIPMRSTDPKVGVVSDIENELPKTLTVNDRFEKLETLEGESILKEIIKGKLVKERNKQHEVSAIEQLRLQHEQTEKESLVYKFFNESRKTVLKNKWLLLGGIFSIAPAALSYLGFVESTQITLSGKFSDITKINTQQQNKLQYQILQKYEKYNNNNPYGWLEKCIGVNNINVISNVTYTLNDDHLYNTTLYDTTTYQLTFTSPNCPGVIPGSTWVAAPADMEFNDYNAIGENSWFYYYQGVLSYKAGIPTQANNYTALDIPEIEISPLSKNIAKIGAGFYATGIYGLSTLSIAETLEHLSDFDFTTKGLVVGVLSVIQGIVRSAPLIVATWLSIKDTINNQALLYLTVGMTGLASILMFLPSFKTVYNRCVGLFFEKNIKNDVINKLDALKSTFISMKPDLIRDIDAKFSVKR